MKQLTHNEIKNTQHKFPITLVCDAIRTPENIGMTFRVAESFGVSKIYLHTSSPFTDNRTVKRTARNTIPKIAYDRYDDSTVLIQQLKKEGYTIIGIEVTNESVNIQHFNFSEHQQIALLLGNERRGVENIHLVDKTVAIPMYGCNSSMNVVNSLAIVLYEATNQFLYNNNKI